VSANFTTRPQV